MLWLRAVLILPVDASPYSILCRQLSSFPKKVFILESFLKSALLTISFDFVIGLCTRSKDLRIFACQRGPPLNCCIAG